MDVWHWKDTVVVPRQKSLLNASRQQRLAAVWHLAGERLVLLGTDPLEDVHQLKHRPATAFTVDRRAYAMERSIGRQFADIHTVDLSSGVRTKVKDRIEDRYLSASPGGRYLLYLQDDHYWVVDVNSGTQTNITKGVKTSFVDQESDDTVKQKPAFGVAGWTADDAAVWLYDRFDIWSISPDGTRSVRLTDGTAEQVRHRRLRLDPDEEWIGPTAHLSLFGIWTKRSGVARLDTSGAAPGVERLLWLDKSVSRLTKAELS